MLYRVVSRKGRYVAQKKGKYWGWNDMFRRFVGFPGGKGCFIPSYFDHPKDAMEAVRQWHMEQKNKAPEDYCQTFYIANNGQICPTADHNWLYTRTRLRQIGDNQCGK